MKRSGKPRRRSGKTERSALIEMRCMTTQHLSSSAAEPRDPQAEPIDSIRRQWVLAGTSLLAAPLLGACGGSDSNSGSPASAEPAPLAATSQRIATRIYGNDAYPVWHRRALPPDAPRARYPGFKPEQVLLRKGEVRRNGALPLPVDIVLERDVAVPLRDGIVIYVDIFRPATPGRYPVIIGWSPYGKQFGGQWLDDLPGRSGVPLASVSELQKFESADPAFWVQQGYAIVNPDCRGAYQSAGNISSWGRQLAEDGYDLIEWLAARDWCSGKLGLAGNSWLAISQWFIAAERPPHLAAIAPWEGFSDVARDQALIGGIPMIPFAELIAATLAGNHLLEDVTKMAVEEPDDSPYWRDKAARLERIAVPAYVVASYDNALHSKGTLDAWQRLGSAEKWLRIHNTHEWPDFYETSNTQELLAFFDCFMKGQDNGWRNTPRVRISVLDPGRRDEVNRVVAAWPPADYVQQPFYLQADHTLASTPAAAAGHVAYAVDGDVPGIFRMRIEQDCEIVGSMKLRLWVEAQGSDDMDLAVVVQKLGPNGEELPRFTGSALQSTGFQRASRRKLDAARSTASSPVLLLQGEEKLAAGEIVPLEIGIAPLGLRLYAGELLQVLVAPYAPVEPQLAFGSAPITLPTDRFTYLPQTLVPTQTLGGAASSSPAWMAQQRIAFKPRNAGTHVLHMGGRFDSHLLLPLKRL